MIKYGLMTENLVRGMDRKTFIQETIKSKNISPVEAAVLSFLPELMPKKIDDALFGAPTLPLSEFNSTQTIWGHEYPQFSRLMGVIDHYDETDIRYMDGSVDGRLFRPAESSYIDFLKEKTDELVEKHLKAIGVSKQAIQSLRGSFSKAIFEGVSYYLAEKFGKNEITDRMNIFFNAALNQILLGNSLDLLRQMIIPETETRLDISYLCQLN